MKCRIIHESAGRIRVRAVQYSMTLDQADILEYYLKSVDGVEDVKVYDRTCDAIIRYKCSRDSIIEALSVFSYEENKQLVPEHTGRALGREYEDKIFSQVAGRLISKTLFPVPVRMAVAAVKNAKYIFKALKVLAEGKIQVAVLDAVAITTSMVRGDLDTAASIMFLLKLGETLEEWTQKKSIADLASAMSLGVENAWLLADGTEVLTPISKINTGDFVVVRTGNMVPLDGKVVSGEAMINQAYITGESEPVRCAEGSYAYAGTVVDDGECTIQVTQSKGGGKYDRIVKMIEESQKLKSNTEDKASHLADHLVPYSLLGTVLTYLITGNATRAISILMVDFSCALKLSMPLAVLSAIREAGQRNISVKGGVYMETVADAETIVFDKTGTLTKATPTVVDVIPFGGHDATEMLKMAACLEEHYPHSMAKAVVEAAKKRAPHEDENHSKVEYVVAHGIVSTIEGQRALIGSYHFVFEEEKCTVPKEDLEKFNTVTDAYSRLYFALGGELAAIICIEDPLKEEAPLVVDKLHRLGFSKVVMMTGDNRRTANMVAEKLGLDEVYSEVMPEDKAEFIRKEHAAGRKVIMIGDGVNDTPALSEADVGIAISEGAAIAREVADVTIGTNDLHSLIILRILSEMLMKRIRYNYRFIMSFNSGLIALGVLGILQPATSALLHNVSTIAISLKSMTNLLEEDKEV